MLITVAGLYIVNALFRWLGGRQGWDAGRIYDGRGDKQREVGRSSTVGHVRCPYSVQPKPGADVTMSKVNSSAVYVLGGRWRRGVGRPPQTRIEPARRYVIDGNGE